MLDFDRDAGILVNGQHVHESFLFKKQMQTNIGRPQGGSASEVQQTF